MLWEALTAVRDLGRLHSLASILIRYGFSDMVQRLGMGHVLERAGRALNWKGVANLSHLETPERVRKALEEMGPTFIKLGQILATRVDLFSPDWIKEFEKLQDQIPALPFDIIKKRLEEDLGSDLDTVFAFIDEQPLAGASIAQVHRARLITGKEVVIKIRRPGIRRTVEADLRLLERLARIAETEISEIRRYQPQEVVRQFTLSLHRELNLAIESRNADRMRNNFANDPNIVIPFHHWHLVDERINVQDYVQGFNSRDLDGIKQAGLDRKTLAVRGANAVLKMILIDGFFHADPHPGNIVYLSGNRIAFFDFGMVGRLTEYRREQVVDLMHSMAIRDPNRIVEVLLDWSDDTLVETDILVVEVDDFIDTYHSVPLKQLKLSNLIIDLADLMRAHQLVLPPDLTLLFKALITLEGLGRQLDPNFDIVSEAAPFLEQAMVDRYRPDILMKRSWRSFTGMMDILTGMPEDLRRLLRAVRGGNVRLNINLSQLEHFGLQLDRAASRLTVGLITAALIIGSSIVMTVSGGPTLFGLPALGLIGFLGAGFGGVWLLVSIWRGTRNLG
ncbi:MAG: AarF/UbiB family protein [Methylococcales bacterium]